MTEKHSLIFGDVLGRKKNLPPHNLAAKVLRKKTKCLLPFSHSLLGNELATLKKGFGGVKKEENGQLHANLLEDASHPQSFVPLLQCSYF